MSVTDFPSCSAKDLEGLWRSASADYDSPALFALWPLPVHTAVGIAQSLIHAMDLLDGLVDYEESPGPGYRRCLYRWLLEAATKIDDPDLSHVGGDLGAVMDDVQEDLESVRARYPLCKRETGAAGVWFIILRNAIRAAEWQHYRAKEAQEASTEPTVTT